MNRKQPEKMDVVSQVKRFLAVKKNLWIVFGVLAVVEVCMVIVVGYLLLKDAGIAQINPRPSVMPTLACVQPTLVIGPATYSISSLSRLADGSVTVPADAAGTAYWIEGTSSSFVFGLSPVPQNQALLAVLKPGDPVRVTWADCSTEEYVFVSAEPGLPENDILFDQLEPGIRVFVQNGPSSQGFVLRGVRPVVQAVETPILEEELGPQMEVEFLETVVSEDGAILRVSIAITNNGSQPIRLAAEDISLTAGNAPAQLPVAVEPGLPQEIAPGARAPFTITFKKPNAQTAVFQMLGFSVDLYY